MFNCTRTHQMNLITFKNLQTKLGNRSRSAIYCDLDHGRLPQPIKMGRRSYWLESDVDQHILNLQDAQNEQA